MTIIKQTAYSSSLWPNLLSTTSYFVSCIKSFSLHSLNAVRSPAAALKWH